MQHLKIYRKEDIESITKLRKFETKLGEQIQTLTNENEVDSAIATSDVKFVIVGVPEDLGVKGNQGMGGADSAWMPFLHAFLNIQSNDFFDGTDILLLGYFDFSEMKSVIERNAVDENEKTEAYRHAVKTVDDEVEYLVKTITENNMIPIIIGGGQNNAYPAIKGAAKGLYKRGDIPLAQINAINLDAHTDYRPLEGRHSGNAFRYADEDGYMEKYCVIGLHENYLSQNCWLDIVNDPFLDFITYEDIFLHQKQSFIEAVAHAINFTDDSYCGIELDLDSIENVLSSASSPVGVNPLHARQYISMAAINAKVAYLHICEGATHLSDGRKNESTGKLISYLVSDFIKGVQY